MPGTENSPTDQQVGGQIATVRVRSDAGPTRPIQSGGSFQQVQKYENGRNSVSAHPLRIRKVAWRSARPLLPRSTGYEPAAILRSANR